MEGFVEPELYLGGGFLVANIYGKATHSFAAHTCTKNLSDKIEKLVGIALNNYGSPLE